MTSFNPNKLSQLNQPTDFTQSEFTPYGRVDSLQASYGDSLRTMWDSMTQKNSAGNWFAGQEDKREGRDPITQEYFDEYNERFKTGLDYIEGETPTQFALRLSQKIRSNATRSRINQQYGVTNFVGAMVPELFNPVNWVVGAMTGGTGSAVRVANVANKTAMAVRTGKKYQAAFRGIGDFFKESLVGNAVVEPLYYANAQRVGDDYTVIDSFANVGLGTVIGTGLFGAPIAATKYKQAGRFLHRQQVYQDMYSFMETGSFDKAMNVALEADPKFESMVLRTKEVGSKVQKMLDDNGVVDYAQLTADEIKVLDRTLIEYYNNVYESALVTQLSEELAEELNENPDVNVHELSAKYKERFANLYDIHVKAREDIELTPEENATYQAVKNKFPYETKSAPKGTEDFAEPVKFTSARYSDNGYEVSSAGDKRFSAFFAKLKDGRTIEQAYQEAKGSGKGQPAKDPNFDYYGTYLGLWKQWAKENPELIKELRNKAKGKVLTDKFAKTDNNQARALADILNEGVDDAPETPKLRQSKLAVTKDVVELAKLMRNLLSQNNATTYSELVAKGIITREQFNSVLKKFHEAYGDTFRQEVEIAMRAVNQVFGYGFKVATSTAKGKFGFVQYKAPDVLNIGRMELLALAQTKGISPTSIIFHEAMHSMRFFDEANWNKVINLIKDTPQLNNKLKEIILDYRGYDPEALDAELPSVFMEWAITQKEFWAELKKRDQNFFEKFRDMLNEMFRQVRNLYTDTDGISTKLKDLNNPAQLAKSFAEILNESRAKRDFDFAAKEAVNLINKNLEVGIRGEEPVYQENAYNDPELDVQYTDMSNTGHGSNNIRQAFDDRFEGIVGDTEVDLLDYLSTLFDKRIKDFPEDLEQQMQETLGPLYETLKREDIEEFKRISKFREFYTRADVIDQYTSLDFSEIKDLDLDLGRKIRNIIGEMSDDDLMDRSKLQDRVAGLVANEAYKRVYRVFQDLRARQSIELMLSGITDRKLKIQQLRTMLDGQMRKGTDGSRVLEIEMIAQSEAAVEPIMQVLHDYGLFELFFGADNTEWMKAYRSTEAEQDVYKIFGNNLRKASNRFHKQLMDGLRNNVMPSEWRNVEGLEKLFTTIQKVENVQLNKMNSVGLFIGKLRTFAGVSQRWSPTIVAGMTKKQFIEDMLPRLDFEETARLHQGVYKRGNKIVEFGEDRASWEEWLGTWYDEIIKDDVGNGADARLDQRKSRLVTITPEAEMDTVLKYSGYTNIGQLMVEQIMQRARSVVLADFGGVEPKTMFDSFARGLPNNINKKSYKMTVDYMTGALDTPVDADLNVFFRALRKLSNILFLSGSGISSLTDIPLVASTLKMQGITLGENSGLLVDAYKSALSRRFSGDTTGMSNFLRAQGAGWDVILNSVSRRLTAEEGAVGRLSGILDKGSNLIFKLNGLNALTTAHQEMYLDVFTRGLAEELEIWNDGGQMDDLLRQNLIDNGISESDFSTLYASIQKTPDGVYRVGPSTINNKALSNKMRSYLKKYMRQAVMTPDAGTNAQATLGFQQGTVIGEMARTATQYQPFMLAMSKLLYRRFANGYFGKNNRNMNRMAHIVAYAGTALAMAYVATILKDILKGKDPIKLTDMTAFEFSRIVQQSGILGVLEIPLDAATFGPGEAVSPLASTLFGVPYNLVTGDMDDAMDNVSQLTGGSILGVGTTIHSLIGTVFGEVLNEIQLSEVDYINKY